MQLCNRTVDLSLSLSPRDYVLLEQICPPQLPVLTSLSLRDANLHEGIFDHLDEGPTEISFTSLFQRMPALKKLQVKEFAIRGSSSYTFCIQTLTSIDLSADGTGSFGVLVDVVQGLSLLSQMPKLQFIRMTVQLGVGTDEETTPLPTVQYGHLEELRLTFVRRSRPLQRDRMTAFFESLQCHSLRTLSMSWQGSLISDIPFRALPLYSVETLELNITLVSESLLECLTLTPNLKSLSFRATDCRSDTTPTAFVYCSLEDLHLLALTRSSQNPTPLCPRLRSFQYLEKNQGRSSGDLVSTAVLTEFIQSREGTLERCDMLFPAMPLFKEEELVRLKG
ncbi:hypothetical protein D9757_012827 [Collybiopsis confluens]|uniref:Uncharacterized protein n=1 Tax=Collybiopsis confluens TaxID=2823264 RepID=A0A8H5D8P6_9AGAR|nr:hypothetical protein D9757_012827 [Collybiopsis confluens]